jgi:hypothetical protein
MSTAPQPGKGLGQPVTFPLPRTTADLPDDPHISGRLALPRFLRAEPPLASSRAEKGLIGTYRDDGRDLGACIAANAG